MVNNKFGSKRPFSVLKKAHTFCKKIEILFVLHIYLPIYSHQNTFQDIERVMISSEKNESVQYSKQL